VIKTREGFWRIAIAMAALLVGIAFGHWATGDNPMPPAKSVPKAALPNPAPLAVAQPERTFAVASSVPPVKPSAPLEGPSRERDPAQRTKMLEESVNHLAAGDFAEALKRASKLPEGNERELTSRLLVARWVELDPDGALAFAAQNRPFQSLASDVFQQLATTDLQGALARAQTIADPGLRYMALRGSLTAMAAQDPAGAAQLAATFGRGAAGQDSLSQVLYRQWATVDPAAAAASAMQNDTANGYRSDIGQVLRTWAAQDPQAALNWSASQKDGRVQGRAVEQIVRGWSEQDPTAVANWISSVPAGASRDAATAAFAASVAFADPKSAVGWAQSIADENQRNNALQRISRDVTRRDPANGPATLQAAGVPEQFIRRGPRPGP
jgi:hypothetical protein